MLFEHTRHCIILKAAMKSGNCPNLTDGVMACRLCLPGVGGLLMEGAGVTGVTGAERPPACSSLPCSSRTVNSTSRATLRTSVRLLHRKLIPSPSMRAKSNLHGQSHQPQKLCSQCIECSCIQSQPCGRPYITRSQQHSTFNQRQDTALPWVRVRCTNIGASWQWQQRCDSLTGIQFVRATLALEPDLAKEGLQARDRLAAS